LPGRAARAPGGLVAFNKAQGNPVESRD